MHIIIYVYTHILVISYIRPQRVCAPKTVHRRLWPNGYIIIIISYYLYYRGKRKILIRATISRSNVYTHIYIYITYNIYIISKCIRCIVLYEHSLQHVFFVSASVFRYTHATGRSGNVFNGYLRNSIQNFFPA